MPPNLKSGFVKRVFFVIMLIISALRLPWLCVNIDFIRICLYAYAGFSRIPNRNLMG